MNRSCGPPGDLAALLCDLLARPNICSKEWIARQYDHEVQGTSVIKPLVGEDRDVPSDAAVMRPVLDVGQGAGLCPGPAAAVFAPSTPIT